MKRSERHRLKENDLSHALNEATAALAEKQRLYGLIAGLVLVVALAAGGYWVWHGRTEGQAQAMLTGALMIVQAPVEAPKPDASGKVVQPAASYPTVAARAEAALVKFNQVADAYPSTRAGIEARYYAASALSTLGRPTDAITRYQEVVDRAGSKDFYGRMAQLGVIEAMLQAKQFDPAIAKAQALSNASDDNLPRDALLMELGRAYAAAGKKTEARQTFDKVLSEFPESAYADEAKAIIVTLT